MTRQLDVQTLLAHRAWVRALSRSIVTDPGRADDVEQATWLTALRRPPADATGLRAWFARVVHSRARDASRDAKRRAVREELALRRGAESSAADVAERFETERCLVREVAALPEPLRTTVLLRFYEDLSVRAVAQRMDVPYETARARLRKALARLRRELGGDEGHSLGVVAALGLGSKGAIVASQKKTVGLALLLALLAGGAGVVLLVTRAGSSPDDDAAAERPAGMAAIDGTAGSDRKSATAPRIRSAEPPVASSPGTTTDSSPAPADGAGEPGPNPGHVTAAAPVSAPPAKLDGKVVDRDTGQPLSDVRVLYMTVKDGRWTDWRGDTTESSGAFTNERPPGWDAPGVHLELRLAKEGYETARLPVADANPRVELVRQTRPPLPGRIVGLARDAAGKLVTGTLCVSGYDEMGSNLSVWTVADAGGVFVLEGMTPGSYRLGVEPSPFVDVLVSEAGEARVEVVVPPEYAAMREEDRRRIPAGFGTQNDEETARSRLPPREVVVTGLPDAAGCVIQARVPGRSPRLSWRAEAKSREARFAGLAVGKWTFVLLRPGEPATQMTVDVPAGEGPLGVEFAGR
jgi:RNA polymerase sigma-70 factor (ECF subfamily)